MDQKGLKLDQNGLKPDKNGLIIIKKRLLAEKIGRRLGQPPLYGKNLSAVLDLLPWYIKVLNY